MSDLRNSKQWETDHLRAQSLKHSEKGRLRAEVQGLLREERETPHVGESLGDQLERQVRIAERSPFRGRPDFNPSRALLLEQTDIRSDKGLVFLAKHMGEGLDSATRRDVRKELVELEKRGELDWLLKSDQKATGKSDQKLEHEEEIRARLQEQAMDRRGGGR